MEAGRAGASFTKIALFSLIAVLVLLIISGLVFALLNVLGVIEGEAVLAFFQDKLPFLGGKGEGVEDDQEIQALRRLEEELAELKEENAQLRGELGQKSREVQELLQGLNELEELTQDWEQERERKKLLGEVYNQMRPQEAASILARLTDEEALDILFLLDTRQVSQVLAQMEAQRAAALTKAINDLERR